MIKFIGLAKMQYGIDIAIRLGCLLPGNKTFKTCIDFKNGPLNTVCGNPTWRKIFNATFPMKYGKTARRTYSMMIHDHYKAFMIPYSIEEAIIKLDLGQLDVI